MIFGNCGTTAAESEDFNEVFRLSRLGERVPEVLLMVDGLFLHRALDFPESERKKLAAAFAPTSSIRELGNSLKDRLRLLQPASSTSQVLTHLRSPIAKRVIAVLATPYSPGSSDEQQAYLAKNPESGLPPGRGELLKGLVDCERTPGNLVIRDLRRIVYAAMNERRPSSQRIPTDQLNSLIEKGLAEMEQGIRWAAVPNAMFAYREFSDADLLEYLTARMDPEIDRLYRNLQTAQWQLILELWTQGAKRYVESD